MENAEAGVHRRRDQGDRRQGPRKADTGARGLRSIIEDVMLDILFELPEQEPGATYMINEDVVAGNQALFSMPEPKNKSA